MGDKLVAVHSHTAYKATARETFRRLSLFEQSHVIWIYVPLPKGDRIVEFCERVSTENPKLLNIIVSPVYMHTLTLLLLTTKAQNASSRSERTRLFP